MSNDPHHHKHVHVTSHTRSLSLLLCMGMLAGVLIWAKLRLVTDIPRSAYADPREHQHPDEAGDGETPTSDGAADADPLHKDDEDNKDEGPASGEHANP